MGKVSRSKETVVLLLFRGNFPVRLAAVLRRRGREGKTLSEEGKRKRGPSEHAGKKEKLK